MSITIFMIIGYWINNFHVPKILLIDFVNFFNVIAKSIALHPEEK